MIITGNKKTTVLTAENVTGVEKIQNFLNVRVNGKLDVHKAFIVTQLTLEDDARISFGDGSSVTIDLLSGSGTIGLVKAENVKKFKAIALKEVSAGAEGFDLVTVRNVEGILVESDDDFEIGTVIFTYKSAKDKPIDYSVFDTGALKEGSSLVNEKKKIKLA